MAKSEAKRQKKLLKKRQQSKVRRQHLAEIVPFAMLSPKQKLRQACRHPIHECLINPSWQEKGLATILMSRRQPDAHMAFGVFLVDIFCLGLKNTFANVDFSEARYVREVVGRVYEQQESEPCDCDLAHQIIYGGIAYAKQFGFKPNKDFRLSQHVLDAAESIGPSDIEFGRDGKPLFVSGPDDNVPKILHQLQATAGEGRYDYLCPVAPDDILSTKLHSHVRYAPRTIFAGLRRQWAVENGTAWDRFLNRLKAYDTKHVTQAGLGIAVS